MEKIFDVHTHLNPVKLRAGGLRGIVGYHFLVSEATGCGSKIYFMNNASDDEWMEEFIPYLPYIKNTSSYWMAKTILKDLYGLDIEKLTVKNWQEFDRAIKEKYEKEETWEWKILIEKCKIGKVFTSWDYPSDFKEPAGTEIFGRTYEKIDLGNKEGHDYLVFWREILKDDVSPANIKKYLKDEVKKVVEGPYHAFVFWTGRYTFREIGERELEKILNSGDKEKIKENFACFVFQTILEEIQKYKRKPTIQLIIGAYVKRVPETKYTRIIDITPSEILYSYQNLFDNFHNLKFDLLVSSTIRSKELDTIARMCPNVSLSGTWLHTMFANDIKNIFSERLDFVPIYKLTGFFSDAYNSEWVYGKLSLSKKCIEEVVEKKIRDGWIEGEKEEILNKLFWENPKRVYTST